MLKEPPCTVLLGSPVSTVNKIRRKVSRREVLNQNYKPSLLFLVSEMFMVLTR